MPVFPQPARHCQFVDAAGKASVAEMQLDSVAILLVVPPTMRLTDYWPHLLFPPLAIVDSVAHLMQNVGVAARALLLIVAAQLVQIGAWAALFIGCREFDDF